MPLNIFERIGVRQGLSLMTLREESLCIFVFLSFCPLFFCPLSVRRRLLPSIFFVASSDLEQLGLAANDLIDLRLVAVGKRLSSGETAPVFVWDGGCPISLNESGGSKVREVNGRRGSLRRRMLTPLNLLLDEGSLFSGPSSIEVLSVGGILPFGAELSVISVEMVEAACRKVEPGSSRKEVIYYKLQATCDVCAP